MTFLQPHIVGGTENERNEEEKSTAEAVKILLPPVARADIHGKNMVGTIRYNRNKIIPDDWFTSYYCCNIDIVSNNVRTKSRRFRERKI